VKFFINNKFAAYNEIPCGERGKRFLPLVEMTGGIRVAEKPGRGPKTTAGKNKFGTILFALIRAIRGKTHLV
jgi:hypothetical protein